VLGVRQGGLRSALIDSWCILMNGACQYSIVILFVSVKKVNGFNLHFHDVGFDVLTAVVMKSSTFWDVISCSLLKISLR
jgi:hypothetical protein